ncbi:MAG: LamG-like jellyroll fold domain-containing protein [Anaerolineae bacterium]|nr:LamG-like jellyroll fold domain-containing protein [Anaerolineae bacterium]
MKKAIRLSLVCIGALTLTVIVYALLSSQASAATQFLVMRFDGNLNDSSGNGLHGTWNGPPAYAAGYSGQAISLSSAVTNYVTVTHSSLLGGMSKLSISVWAKKSNAAQGGMLVYKRDQYRILLGANSITAFVRGNRQATVSSSAAISDTNWHHYVLGYDGVTVKLFCDGVLLDSEPLTGTVAQYTGPLYIGRDPWGSQFSGLIDELVINDDPPDVDPPFFDGHDPAPGATWVRPDTNIVVHVKDVGRGVLSSTIVMTVEGSVVSPAITGTPADYTITYDPPANFAYGQEVNVSLSAADVDGNRAVQSYAFTIQQVSDTFPPRGYFYVKDLGAGQATIYNYFQDPESGMGSGAQMRFSNDNVTWSAPEPYSSTKSWTLAAASGKRTVYGRFSDAAGNWTDVLSYTLGAEYEDDLVVIPNAPNAAHLIWRAKPGVAQYVVLRSNKLGWSGTIRLTEPVTTGGKIITVTTTAGLQAGDELHFSGGRDDYYIARVLDARRLELTVGVQRDYVTNTVVNLSACWVRDYSGYTEIARFTSASGVREYVDTGLELEKDYFYVIGYSDGVTITGYSNPVQARLTGSGMLYDAALGAYGGYAWKVTQNYGDTPNLIDGDDTTSEVRIQYNDPAISDPYEMHLGFHRVHLQERLPIRRVEIIQDMSADRTRAAHIRLGFDDRSFQTFDLENDPRIVRVDVGSRRTYRIPVDKTSAYVSIYIEDVANPAGNYTLWYKIGVYTDRRIVRPVTSAAEVRSAHLAFDFSRSDGTLPTIFGSDEVWNNVDGYETGAMLRAWPYLKEVFNLYRVQVGDGWPHAYGWDQVKVAELAAVITPAQTTFMLTNVITFPVSLSVGTKFKVDYELMQITALSGNRITVTRGLEHTEPVTHTAGSPLYVYRSVGQILRLQEALPEFPVVKYTNAYVSGITPISSDLPVTHSLRTAVITITVNKGTYAVSDVIRVGREAFLVQAVDASNPSQIRLTVRRGYDGTAQEYIQHNIPQPDVYKYLNYEPYYVGFKNDPTNPNNYFWDNWDMTWDKVIRQGDAIPWIIAWSPWYATQARGRVAALETITNARGIQNNVIVDEYNSTHDDADWWYLLASGNTLENDSNIRGNMYEFYHARIYFLTGNAAGKVFFIRSHSGDRLRVVRTWNDSTWSVTNPEYVDLYAEGVRPGDAYIVTHSTQSAANVAPKFWRYNAAIFYNLVKHLRQKYAAELAGKPIYIEYYLEPNLGSYGTWTLDAYVDSYNVFARTLREGGPGLGPGLTKNDVIIGAGAIAGGLNPSVPIPGTNRDYDIALTLIEEADYLDFVSHHRYYMGSRVQKRENSWEYWMLRTYAQSLGKDIVIIDSEDSVATAGGTGREEARHWARFSVPYWEANFINSYAGDYGPLGRLAFIIHFRTFDDNTNDMGMAAMDAEGRPVLDLVYWPILMYQQHTSEDPQRPDTVVFTVQGSDPYGWVQGMGTIHGQTGVRHVHLVNKKETPITVTLTLSGVTPTGAVMHSVIGCGPQQTIQDGYHPLTLTGAIVQTILPNPNVVVLQPCSANIIALEGTAIRSVYLPLVLRNQ